MVLGPTLNLLAAFFIPHLHIRATVWQSVAQDQLQVLVTGVELRTQIVLQVVIDLLVSSEQGRSGSELLNI